jgi:hypothetical protein
MLARSKPLLRDLALAGADISPEDPIEVLRCISSSLEVFRLSTEKIREGCVTDNVLRLLTCHPYTSETEEHPPLCPNLIHVYRRWTVF